MYHNVLQWDCHLSLRTIRYIDFKINAIVIILYNLILSIVTCRLDCYSCSSMTMTTCYNFHIIYDYNFHIPCKLNVCLLPLFRITTLGILIVEPDTYIIMLHWKQNSGVCFLGECWSHVQFSCMVWHHHVSFTNVR